MCVQLRATHGIVVKVTRARGHAARRYLSQTSLASRSSSLNVNGPLALRLAPAAAGPPTVRTSRKSCAPLRCSIACTASSASSLTRACFFSEYFQYERTRLPPSMCICLRWKPSGSERAFLATGFSMTICSRCAVACASRASSSRPRSATAALPASSRLFATTTLYCHQAYCMRSAALACPLAITYTSLRFVSSLARCCRALRPR
mmetsp:Transcript_5936/g.18624  ORF Transcript_5936/g.18624 Transcript_5936/m.18624 type:complete len:205 (-) Transcript_5936:543-1157(-)